MQYYDLVDTLIITPTSNGLSGYLKGLEYARKKYTPAGAFQIITSQPTAAHKAVAKLVREMYPNCVGLHQVESTAGKIQVLRRLKADNYTDNDPTVRKQIANNLEGIRLYKIANGKKVEA